MIRSIGAFLGKFTTYSCLICAAAAVVSSLPARAETTATYENGTIHISFTQFTKETDTARRIDLSGKLRMLSQRVVSDACFVQTGIANNDIVPNLRATISEVGAIAHALEYGDTNLGIFDAEERRKTLAVLAQFNEIWAPMQINALLIAQGEGTFDDILALNTQSAELLQVSHMLVSTVAAQYFDPTQMRLADAMLIDIAERQQFLAQQIAKNTCLASSSIATESMTEELWSARMAFNSTMGALSSGMPSLGIQAPPTTKIDASLNAVRSAWLEMRQPIDAQLSGDMLDQSQLAAIFYGADDMTNQMSGVIGLYAQASRFGS
ncbi:type IV pili methyl-accepting chemotaxis transducer N-terminal domain-containing protein [Yoonia algicola]|uniref:Type IV pili methyl-accepting chemotaxis transducer N-terminal domain-containing protein n=1 Tax=Yoonia algicola TaxID=3137368 RepID=A0AAN0M2V4_9RHOB